ncbi:MAG: hypothetical protein J0H69_19105 [Burkholderiales bacterium]|nr:hypothetical protein [Burkholderiales bacterium]
MPASPIHIDPASGLRALLDDTSRTIRLFFSRRDAGHARSAALRVARAALRLHAGSDPLQAWPASLQLDPGLGRARCLQRLMPLDTWSVASDDVDPGPAGLDNAAGYLFVAVMLLAPRIALSAEAQVLRLWYLGTRSSMQRPDVQRVFGDLRPLPAHQQLAVGAYVLDRMDARREAKAAGEAALSPQAATTAAAAAHAAGHRPAPALHH